MYINVCTCTILYLYVCSGPQSRQPSPRGPQTDAFFTTPYPNAPTLPLQQGGAGAVGVGVVQQLPLPGASPSAVPPQVQQGVYYTYPAMAYPGSGYPMPQMQNPGGGMQQMQPMMYPQMIQPMQSPPGGPMTLLGPGKQQQMTWAPAMPMNQQYPVAILPGQVPQGMMMQQQGVPYMTPNTGPQQPNRGPHMGPPLSPAGGGKRYNKGPGGNMGGRGGQNYNPSPGNRGSRAYSQDGTGETL